jgi:hypothetical protein
LNIFLEVFELPEALEIAEEPQIFEEVNVEMLLWPREEMHVAILTHMRVEMLLWPREEMYVAILTHIRVERNAFVA